MFNNQSIQGVTQMSQPTVLTDDELGRQHAFVRSTLAHHGISQAHTALVADLIHGLEDLNASQRQARQKSLPVVDKREVRFGTQEQRMRTLEEVCGVPAHVRAAQILDAFKDAPFVQAQGCLGGEKAP
jgi:hypothetical protein